MRCYFSFRFFLLSYSIPNFFFRFSRPSSSIYSIGSAARTVYTSYNVQCTCWLEDCPTANSNRNLSPTFRYNSIDVDTMMMAYNLLFSFETKIGFNWSVTDSDRTQQQQKQQQQHQNRWEKKKKKWKKKKSRWWWWCHPSIVRGRFGVVVAAAGPHAIAITEKKNCNWMFAHWFVPSRFCSDDSWLHRLCTLHPCIRIGQPLAICCWMRC